MAFAADLRAVQIDLAELHFPPKARLAAGTFGEVSMVRMTLCGEAWRATTTSSADSL